MFFCSIIIQENIEFDQRAKQHKGLDSRLRSFHNGKCDFERYHFQGKKNFRAAIPLRRHNVTNTRDWFALKFRWISFIGYFYIYCQRIQHTKQTHTAIQTKLCACSNKIHMRLQRYVVFIMKISDKRNPFK